MDIRDFLTKIDAIQNKEQMKEDVKKIHLKEASQVMLYGDTPEDMAAIAQIFKSAGVPEPKEKEMTIPLPTSKPEESVEEEIPGEASTTPDPEYKDTQYMTKDVSGGINKIKRTYPKVAGGDNPMAPVQKTEEEVQSSIKETLLQAYQDFKKQS
jgi:hypothetical protein